MTKNRMTPAALSAVALACLVAMEARAQQAPAPADAASAAKSATLDAVVITAQKRKEDVRKVPLSVSVVSGDAIQENHINDVTDLSRSVPNLSFSSQAGAGLSVRRCCVTKRSCCKGSVSLARPGFPDRCSARRSSTPTRPFRL